MIDMGVAGERFAARIIRGTDTNGSCAQTAGTIHVITQL
jgi:hypothetical protein